MNAYARAPREGWQTATVLTVVFGGFAVLFTSLSIIGLFFVISPIIGTILGIVCAIVGNKTWRAICAGFALANFFIFSFVAFWIGLWWSILGVGLLLMAGSVFALVAAICCIVELVKTIQGQDPAARGAVTGFGGYAQPQIVINNSASNNNRLQVGDDYSSRQTIATNARVGIIDSGRALPDLRVSSSAALIVGRDAGADIRISDPRASRRHLEIRIEGSTWVVRDLGATNPARVISSRGDERQVHGGSTRLEQGQIAVGESIITLYPLNGRN